MHCAFPCNWIFPLPKLSNCLENANANGSFWSWTRMFMVRHNSLTLRYRYDSFKHALIWSAMYHVEWSVMSVWNHRIAAVKHHRKVWYYFWDLSVFYRELQVNASAFIPDNNFGFSQTFSHAWMLLCASHCVWICVNVQKQLECWMPSPPTIKQGCCNTCRSNCLIAIEIWFYDRMRASIREMRNKNPPCCDAIDKLIRSYIFFCSAVSSYLLFATKVACRSVACAEHRC